MKKHLIFALIGGSILFFWQFLSHAAMNLHAQSQEYTPKQLAILNAIEAYGLEPGQYFLGMPDPEATEQEKESMSASFADKPWGILNYQTEPNGMTMNLIRGFLIAILVAGLFHWLVTNMVDVDMKKGLLAGLAVGMISYFLEPYSDFIWFKTPGILAHLVDAIVPWAILGALSSRIGIQKA